MPVTVLPMNLVHLATTTPGSDSRTWQSIVHPSLPLLATACANKTIRIYSLTSFTLLSTITGGHRRSVRCCAWKPGVGRDGEITLATGSFDATAAIWVGYKGAGHDKSMDPDSDYSGEEDYRFAVVLEGHDSEIKSIAWSKHGKFLATCSRDKSVWIWEALEDGSGGVSGMIGGATEEDEDNYETVGVLQEHDGDVKCVSWHPEDENCLASGSYDEYIRVWREDIDGEWSCVGVCDGHKGTVWSVDWEPTSSLLNRDIKENVSNIESGPRLISCSDDLTIRIWRRKPKAKPKLPTGPRIPSIIRSTGDEEEWFEESQLPQRHDRTIYSIAWSKQSGRVVSAGSDGRIVVYEERPIAQEVLRTTDSIENTIENAGKENLNNEDAKPQLPATEWSVVAEIEAAHNVFEINHVCWASRYDRDRVNDDEEQIITTGDDGEVKIWVLKPNTSS